MKARPIPFSAPMVRALLEGRKTQTRRLLTPQPEITESGWLQWRGGECAIDCFASAIVDDCPKGQCGDLLWVRETCRAHELSDAEAENDTYGVMERLGLEAPLYGLDGVIYNADGTFREIANTIKASHEWCELNFYRGKRGATVPPIHMPRWASRITLRITDVRAERLQDISEADAIAEGARSFEYLPRQRPFQSDCWSMESPTSREQCLGSARLAFANFISKLHGGDNWNLKPTNLWDQNPWVWAITFDPLKQNVDQLMQAAA